MRGKPFRYCMPHSWWPIQGEFSSSILCYCLPELALGRPRIKQRLCVSVCVCVCLCVLTGKELWIYWSDFNDNLVPVHCYSLVVYCKIWKELLGPFTFFWGGVTPDFPIKSYGSIQCCCCLLFLKSSPSSSTAWHPLFLCSHKSQLPQLLKDLCYGKLGSKVVNYCQSP